MRDPRTERRVIDWFSEQMFAKLRANADKGGWREDPLVDLLDRLREEVAELDEELQAAAAENHFWGDYGADQIDRIAAEAADVANFAMFVADAVRHRKIKSPAKAGATLKKGRHAA